MQEKSPYRQKKILLTALRKKCLPCRENSAYRTKKNLLTGWRKYSLPHDGKFILPCIIFGRHANGRYIVTRNKDDVAYYRQRANDLLERARPLMQIFQEPQMESFRRNIVRIIDKSKTLHSLSNVPPLFTMSEDLLESVLSHSGASDTEKDRIREYHKKYSAFAASRLVSLQYMLELSEVTTEDYEKYPARLPVSEIFPAADIRYTEEEYRTHIKEAQNYAQENPGFSISANSMPAFRNIDITISPGRAALVSKSNLPVIHFLILHPQMIAAFEQFAPPIYER